MHFFGIMIKLETDRECRMDVCDIHAVPPCGMQGVSMIYVTADIHGYYEAFMHLLREIDFSQRDFLYVIGDTIDKGPESFRVLEHIMDAENMELILGNHEEFLLEGLKSRVYGKRNFIDMELWYKHGGKETFEEYNRMSAEQQQRIFRFLSTRPLYQILGGTVLVHGGVIPKKTQYSSWEELMEEQDRQTLLWAKEEFLMHPFDINLEGRVIFGHTPTSEIQRVRGEKQTPGVVWRNGKRMGIDGGYLFGGRLIAICLM